MQNQQHHIRLPGMSQVFACLAIFLALAFSFTSVLNMEARGVKAIPTFHQGEDERYLEHYIRNYEYISLGGMVGGNVKQLRIWLDRVFDRFIVDKSGQARLKVHGFGLTSYELMERYPWHSVDSATWGHAAQYGEIMSPEFGRLIVSDQSGALKTEGRHVDTLTEIEFNYIMKTLEAGGWNYSALQAKLEHRAAYNLNTYLIWERQINEKAGKFTPKVMELF